MRRALLFEDLFAFCDFVRLHGSGKLAKRDYRLYHLEHPHFARHTLLALAGLPRQLPADLDPQSGTKTLLDLRHGKITVKDGRAKLSHLQGFEAQRPEQKRFDVTIRSQNRESTLLGLIRPVPWQAEPESARHLLFWLNDASLLAPLVTASLRLGNDRMRYADVRTQDEGTVTLLRIEEPSYFLIQQVIEDSRSVELYYPAAEDLYLPWGLAHPLAELWRQSEQQRQDAWILFRRDGSRHHVVPPRWHDVYDATRFTIDLGERPLARQVASEQRIEIRLELVTRSNPGEPELWLLDEADRPRLEALLAGVDEQDLDHLALSAHHDAEGRKLYVVREKRGRKRRFFDFGGRGFAAFQGLNNLYLPVDRELLPQLRRDRYRDLFQPRSGEIALVIDGDNGAITLYRLDESSFEPLDSLIDYLAAEADERLEAWVQASVFDLGPYLQAPSRPGLQPLKSAARAAEDTEPEAEKVQEAATREESKAEGNVADGSPEPELEPDIETREKLAERALLAEGQSFERWLEILEAKLEAKKWEDAAVAFVDTLWLADDSAAEARLFARWHRFIGARQDDLSDLETALATDSVLRLRKQRRSERDRGLYEASNRLREIDDDMRIKQRWLLWREILARNHDVRHLARLREDSQQQLSLGLSQAEIPAFLRMRLFDDSRFEAAGTDRQAAAELADATRSLDVLTQGLREASVGDVALAILGRAYARVLGQVDRARALAGEPRSHDDWIAAARALNPTDEGRWDLQQPTVNAARACHALYCSHSFELDAPDLAAAYRAAFDQHMDDLDAASRLDSKALADLHLLENSLARREKIDNPSAFLSAANAERFFPTGGDKASGSFGRLLRRLRKADIEESLELLPTVFDDHLASASDLDPVDLAELLDVTLQALERVRWESKGLPFLRRFEAVAGELGQGQSDDRFYLALINSNLARGLIELGHEQRATRLITAAFDELSEASSPIDLVDGSAALLGAIEGLELERRAPLIRAFSTCLRQWLGRETVIEQHYAHLAPKFYRLLDQAAEAAVSKDKLALGLFRRYQQQDEFLILDRILRDQPTEGG